MKHFNFDKFSNKVNQKIFLNLEQVNQKLIRIWLALIRKSISNEYFFDESVDEMTEKQKLIKVQKFCLKMSTILFFDFEGVYYRIQLKKSKTPLSKKCCKLTDLNNFFKDYDAS